MNSIDIEALSLYVLPVLVGLALIVLARWARRKNRDSNRAGHSYAIDGWSALKSGDVNRAAKVYLTATPPAPYENVVRYLAIIVIVAVSSFLLVAIYAILNQ